jgi:hypothetical protein
MTDSEVYTVQFAGLDGPDGEAVTIRTAAGEQLTRDMLARAGRHAGTLLQQTRDQQARDTWDELIRPLLTEELRLAWTGKVTDLYLATLAKAYWVVSTEPYLKIIPTLADMLDRSANTIKMHVVRARDREMLSLTEGGKGEGELTAKGERTLRQQSTVPQDTTGLPSEER